MNKGYLGSGRKNNTLETIDSVPIESINLKANAIRFFPALSSPRNISAKSIGGVAGAGFQQPKIVGTKNIIPQQKFDIDFNTKYMKLGGGTASYGSTTAGNIYIVGTNFGYLGKSTDGGLTWSSQTGIGGVNRALSFGNGTFVLGGDASIYTSTDTAVWTARTSNFGSSTITTIGFGNGIFIAGGAGGTLRTSTDGVTWVTQTSNFGTSTIGSDRGGVCIAYGGTTWVAVGAGGTLRTSADNGVTWVTQTSNFGTTDITSVGYANGLWLAGGPNGTLRASTDAVTWATVAYGTTDSITTLAYGNGMWMASGSATKVSVNGYTWVPQIFAPGMYCVTYNTTSASWFGNSGGGAAPGKLYKSKATDAANGYLYPLNATGGQQYYSPTPTTGWVIQ